MTTKLRGRIKTLNVKTIRCHIHPEPLTDEEIERHVRQHPAYKDHPWNPYTNAEHDYEYWVGYNSKPINATFRLSLGGPNGVEVANRMYERAYKAMDRDVILTAEAGNVLRKIEVITRAPECHFCHLPKFDEERKAWVAICDNRSYRCRERKILRTCPCSNRWTRLSCPSCVYV
jgi:hypothetical protein